MDKRKEGVACVFSHHQIIDIFALVPPAICPTHPIHHNVALDSGSEENHVRSQSSRDITHVLILVS